MAVQWFKFYGSEYLTDPKIKSLTACQRQCWTTLLALSSTSECEGIVKHLTEKQLMLDAGIDFTKEEWKETVGVLDVFKNKEMIDVHDNVITLRNWNKKQEKTLTAYERVKRYRLRNDNAEITDETNDNEDDNARVEENRIDKNRKEEKNTYGEFLKVKLLKEEYEKLIEKIGEKNTAILITELDSYIASKGKKYSSHYATILNWARRRVSDHQSKISAKTKTIA